MNKIIPPRPKPLRQAGGGGRGKPGSRRPAPYSHAFIVTYGRSGSTLLQGVLNALPGYLIRGENWDLLGEMQKFHDALPRHGENRGGGTGAGRKSGPEMPHFGFERFTDDRYAVALRRFLDTMLVDNPAAPGLRCLGFKEIHYTPVDVSDKVDFLRMLYPGCAIVYNIRDPEAVAASEFQKNKPADYFRSFNAILADLASVDRNSILVRYEDVVAGTGSLLRLHTFLQEPFDPAAHAATLSRKHSYHSIKPGSMHSNVPGQAQVAKTLRGLDLFVVDKVQVTGGTTQVDGFLIETAGAPPRRFATLRDEHGGDIPFSAEYGLSSPRVGKQMGVDSAAQSRFALRFQATRAATVELFLDGGELAVTLRPPAVDVGGAASGASP